MVTTEMRPSVRSATCFAKNSSPSPGRLVAGYSFTSVHCSPCSWATAQIGTRAAKRAAASFTGIILTRTRLLARFAGHPGEGNHETPSRAHRRGDARRLRHAFRADEVGHAHSFFAGYGEHREHHAVRLRRGEGLG